MIEVSHLYKKYGDHYAVKDLSFTLESGKIYGLLGPNGAGKSTTMNMITGYIAPTSGSILVEGHDILEEPEEVKRAIGYLPEIPPLYIDMTVMEYLITVADLKGIPAKSRQTVAVGVMEKVKITEMKDRLIKNLSKGYRQRVGIAQALIGSPKLVILDEPTVGLDPEQILEIRDLIRDLGREHTVILSSHILSEISAVCDHVLIINKGEMIASGDTADLENMVQGQNSLELVAEGNPEKLDQVLNAFAQISEKEIIREAGMPGACRVRLKMKGTEDIRRELFYRFAEEKLPILELKSSGLSLEEVFLELVRSENTDNRENAASESDNVQAAVKEEV